MSAIDVVRKYFSRKEIKRIVKENIRTRAFPNYNKIQNIAIIFDSDEDEENRWLTKMTERFRRDGKNLYLWGKLKKKSPQSAIRLENRLFGNSELNEYGIPTSDLLDEFGVRVYDMIIGLYDGENYPLDALLASGKATFKASSHRNIADIADLQIEMSDHKGDRGFLLNQILFYLDSIQTKD